MLRACLAVSLLLGAVWTTACDTECPPGQTKARVHNGYGQETPSYVCVPADEPEPAPSRPAPPQPLGCGRVDTPGREVPVLAQAGAPPPLLDTPVPDGFYTLVAARAYSPEAAAPPVTALRASLVVSGAQLAFGGQAGADAGADGNETFTFTLDAGVLTKLCQTNVGPLAGWIFPGSLRTVEDGAMSWNATAHELTLRVADEVDFVFAPY